MSAVLDVCEVNNGGCEHICMDGECRCNPGYRLNSDGRSCDGNIILRSIFLPPFTVVICSCCINMAGLFSGFHGQPYSHQISTSVPTTMVDVIRTVLTVRAHFIAPVVMAFVLDPMVGPALVSSPSSLLLLCHFIHSLQY